MCILVDANVAPRFFSGKDPELKPLQDFIYRGSSMMVIGGKLREELFHNQQVRSAIVTLNQSGRVAVFGTNSITTEVRKLQHSLLASDDAHIIALARISGARILFSNDQALHKDFRNPELINNPRGRVYQNRSHQHLLLQPCRLREVTR